VSRLNFKQSQPTRLPLQAKQTSLEATLATLTPSGRVGSDLLQPIANQAIFSRHGLGLGSGVGRPLGVGFVRGVGVGRGVGVAEGVGVGVTVGVAVGVTVGVGVGVGPPDGKTRT